MRISRTSLRRKFWLASIALAGCLGIALLIFGFLRIFAEPLGDEARVYENDQLTYYITVNSDGIDHEGITSSDSQISDEVSGITTITDILPDGLTFEGFVTSSDGTFGAVRRDDKATQCSGRVIDDTNEASLTDGIWNVGGTEFTYHGLHYDANTRKVTFRTKGIGAGCELTVGVITRTPTLPDNVLRMDFYDHASYLDESLFGDSNTVHAWIQKSATQGEWQLSYRYDGIVPTNAPSLPLTTTYEDKYAAIEVAALPTMDGYTFDGWYYDPSAYDIKKNANSLTALPGNSVELYGSWTPTGSSTNNDPVKYDVDYEIDGTKPTSFNLPAKRSYYEGTSVEVDTTESGANFDGYDFSGWDTDDIDLDDTEFVMPSRNVTLRGSFNRESYTVSYAFLGDVKPEDADSLLPATTAHYAGDVITLANAVSANGYSFLGWMADPSFEMPAENVVIYGEWTRNKTEFTPGISIEIINPENEYHKGDTVRFAVTVTNGESFDLDNVWLQELLDGALFVSGDNYSIEQGTFAKIDKISANSSVTVYAEYPVTKNIEKIYTNEVELISADISDDSYALPDEWNNKASVDFATGVIPDIPVDEDEDDSKNPITYDCFGKMVISGVVFAGGLGLCVLLAKKNRRGKIVYGFYAGIMAVSGLAVIMVNGGFSYADDDALRPELDIYSSKLNYTNGDAGAWRVHESARWVGVGEAVLNIRVDSNRISDLHNRDVVLVLDNSNWTGYAIDGTEPDDDTDKLTIDIMKDGALNFANSLLRDGDSRIVVMPTWGDAAGDLTSDIDEVRSQMSGIVPSSNTNYNSYAETYDKLLAYLDRYLERDDISERSLKIVYVSDDHVSNSSDIAKYKMVKAKAPKATIAGIGIGVIEIMNERYASMSTAFDLGVGRYWMGIDGNLAPTNRYDRAVNGLDKISDWHGNPSKDSYVASLIKAIDGAQSYDKFNIETQINLDDFTIEGIFGDDGDITVNEGKISWKNETKGLVSGINYNMNVLLKAKDETVAKHKLYSLNTSTKVETDAKDIEADSVSAGLGVVLMNGYELNFDINNTSTCSLGNNVSGRVYLAFQKIDIDESGVGCEGWNFDTFKNNAENGLIYGSKNNQMPAQDMTLKATWRKIGTEVHMDGRIYSVAPAILMDGLSFNKKLYGIAGSSELLLRADACPSAYMDEAHRISDDDSATKIYAWRSDASSYGYVYYQDETRPYSYYKPTFYCSDSETIVMNENSKGLFGNGFYNEIDGVSDYSYYYYSYYRLFDESVGEWDASNVKNMDHIFYNSELGTVALDILNSWDTSNVENMDYLFDDAYISSGYDYSKAFKDWDVSNVTSMRYAFSNMGSVDLLTGIGNWDVSGVKDMTGIFSGGSSYNTKSFPQLASWDVSNVESFERAFALSSYTSYDSGSHADFSGIAGWNLSSAKSTKGMFSGREIADMSAFSGWNMSNVEDASEMFESTKFWDDGVVGSTASLSSWDVSSMKNVSSMFESSNVTNIAPLSGWGSTTKNIEDYSSMFLETKLANLNGLQTWDTSSAKNMSYMFATDRSNNYVLDQLPRDLTDINGVSTWDVSNVENMEGMFRGAYPANLTALADWNVSKVENMAYMFCGTRYSKSLFCTNTGVGRSNNGTVTIKPAYGGPRSLTGLENWNTASLKNMEAIFAGGELTDLSPISGWDVSKVENMKLAFAGLNTNNFGALSGWTTTSLTRMDSMFYGNNATSLSGLEGFDVSKVTSMSMSFMDMTKLADITALSGWNTSSLGSMEKTFMGHKALASLAGLEGWDVSKVTSFNYTFTGYEPYTASRYSVTNWSTYGQSILTDISALSTWDISSAGWMEDFISANRQLSDISPLAGFRMKEVRGLSGFFEGDSSITNLDALTHWYDDADDLETAINVEYSFMFAYMSQLADVSALSNWTSSKINPTYIESLMRNDSRVTSFEPLNNTFFNKTYTANQKRNAFDGTYGTRPSWY